MKKNLIIVFLLVSCLNSFSQEKERFTSQIKFSPLRLINPISPGIELNYEISYLKFSTQVSAAYLTDMFNIAIDYMDINGFRFCLEEKYFFKVSKNRKNKLYFSAEIGYHQVEMLVDAYFLPEWEEKEWKGRNENQYQDRFDLDRKSIILNAKAGYQFVSKHFVLDFNIGLGAMFQNVKHYNRKNPKDHIIWEFEDLISPLFEEEGRYIAPNLPFSFKIGWVF